MARATSSTRYCRAAGACWIAAALLASVHAGGARAETGLPAPPTVPQPAGPTVAAPVPPQLPQAGAVAPPAAAAPTAGLALPPQPPPPSLSPPPDEKRGFLNDFGKWWDKSVADFNAKIKDQQSSLGDVNKQQKAAATDAASATQQAMKNAADAMVRMTTPSHVVEAQEVCPLAGNGAPDCAVAAATICHAKGFKEGQPVDIRTAEKCTASLWVSGQPPPVNGDCPEETVVLRAACQ